MTHGECFSLLYPRQCQEVGNMEILNKTRQKEPQEKSVFSGQKTRKGRN